MRRVCKSIYRTSVSCFCVSFALVSVSGMAFAGSSYVSIAPTTQTLDLAVGGYIKPHCSFELGNEYVRVELNDRANSTSIPFNLDCNVPLEFSVESQNGALDHAAIDRIDSYPGFQARLPYDVDLDFDVPNANRLSFESEDIQAVPGTGQLQVIPYQSGGHVRLNWNPEAPLLAGKYNDIIRIRVTGDGSTKSHW